MSQSYKRVLATLPNATTIYIYNMDQSAEFPESVIVSGKPETSISAKGTVQYKFSNPSSGWFCSIAEQDTDRMSQVLQTASGDIAIKLSPLPEVTDKDLATAKPFQPAKDK
jgi:hypothetical protein